MSYTAPVDGLVHALKHIVGFHGAVEAGRFGDLDTETVEAVLEEAGKFAADRLAPLNAVGDRNGSRRNDDGTVTTPKGFAEAYRDWCEAGWNGLSAPVDFGGQGLPLTLASAVNEIWTAANMAFHLCPLLGQGAIEALATHASAELRDAYLEKVVSGEWTATMNLTEPQAGSDLAALRSRAEPAGDGTYRIFGQKIFITYGEHDMTENICHLVLARLPDAPAGTRGISLFLVPKILPDGSRNDLVCSGVEHKLGIHASPTCTMVFGDQGGAVGYIIGEENRGLACMFTMMNSARLAVGVQGAGIAERATQAALAYAHERRQGKALVATGEGMAPIVAHPDIRRTLMTMRAASEAARAICLTCAFHLDLAHAGGDDAARHGELGALWTPVAKAFAPDLGVEVASMGIQVHGGMGFIEETGAAQYLRDARIAPIYEGTNGIQAIDLVTRKLPLSGGTTVSAAIEDFRKIAVAVSEKNAAEFGATGDELERAVTALQEVTKHLLESGANDPAALLGAATPYLRLFGLTAGAALLARGALSAGTLEATVSARVFAEHWLTGAEGIARTILRGTAVIGADLADLRIA